MPEVITPILEIRDAILERGAQDARKCYQCGKCMSSCPWFQVEAVSYPVYRFPQAVKLGVVTSSENKEVLAREVEDLFRCFACDACRVACPRGVDMAKVLRAVRRILVDYANLPQELRSMLSKTRSSGNPLGEPREKRTAWAEPLGVGPFTPDMDALYFSCCIPAYNQRAQSLAIATATILRKAGLTFGTLGASESCCGETVCKVGAEKVFSELAGANIAAFRAAGARRIVTTSPHCYSAFKTDYGEWGFEVEVLHETQLFAELIERGLLKPRTKVNRRVVYHDPCLLGRVHGVYEEPRWVLRHIPGLEIVEIENFSREQSLCCGGGGGGFWLDRPPDERVTNVRALQAYRTGADTLAVACPYCLQMFEDAVKVLAVPMEVRSVGELLAEAL